MVPFPFALFLKINHEPRLKRHIFLKEKEKSGIAEDPKYMGSLVSTVSISAISQVVVLNQFPIRAIPLTLRNLMNQKTVTTRDLLK